MVNNVRASMAAERMQLHSRHAALPQTPPRVATSDADTTNSVVAKARHASHYRAAVCTHLDDGDDPLSC